MKLVTILLFSMLMQVSAATFAQRLTLKREQVSLEQVFREIRKQTDYGVFITTPEFKKVPKLNVDFRDTPLAQVMEVLVSGTDLVYTFEGNTIVVSARENKAEQGRVLMDVKGKVVDELGRPLPGASVKVKNSTLATITDTDGKFKLSYVEADDILVISFIGYQTQELKAERDMIITLQPQVSKLQEVQVSSGYWNTSRELSTGSIGKVDAKTIERQPVLNPLAAIQGRITGVSVTQTTGIPGGDFNIEIRGRNSLRSDGSQPLYVVDGVPFSQDKVSSQYAVSGILGTGANPLNGINNADIESIQVLKDADATAIYGSRGANGVVLITTKKGKAGKTGINVDYYTGGAKAPTIRMLSTPDYLALRREAFANDGLTPSSNPNDLGAGGKLYAPDLTIWDQQRDHDWQRELLGNTATSTSLQASLSGGNEQTQFLLGTGYRKETNVFPGDYGFDKGSLHFSMNHLSNDRKLSLVFSASGTVDRNNQTYIDITNRSRAYAPNMPDMKKPDGSFNWDPTLEDNLYAALSRTYLGNSSTLVGNAVLGYQLAKGLQLKSSFGFTQVQSHERSKWPSTFYRPAPGISSAVAYVADANGTNSSWIIEPQLSYEAELGPGRLSALLGSSFQDQRFGRQSDGYNGFPSDALLDNLSAATTRGRQEYVRYRYRYHAVFGRLNYILQDKYILNLTGRRDGSSRFGPGKRFSNFGAVGAAWLFGKEAWVQDHLPFLSFGKLRASYGTSGNDQIGNYQYLDTYAPPSQAPQYDGITVLNPTRLYNPVLSWETNQKLEAAVELGFLQDRINVTAGWFRNRSGNQLVNYTLPVTSGFSGILSNFPALVENTGLELELHTQNIRGKKFRWTSDFNITFPRNRLLAFPGIEDTPYGNQYIVGRSLYIQQLYAFTGVDPQSGYYTFRDYNGDGLISSPNDNKAVADIGQRFFGGWNNSFSYGNWSLEVFFQFVRQNGYNFWYSLAFVGYLNNQPSVVAELPRWQQPGDIATVQRAATEFNNQAVTTQMLLQRSDAAISDATFLRCKNVSLSYRLPAQWLKGLNGRVYVQGQNLFVISNYRFFDPESQHVRLAPLKVLTAGVQFSF